jgi:hypothetical protein
VSAGGAFSIGSQQAGAIYQAAGHQTIRHAGGTLTMGPLGAAEELRAGLRTATLPEPTRREAERALDAVEAELERPAPDQERVGAHLDRLVAGLGKAGALATAGESLLRPLRSLACWLGPAGLAALRLLT